MLTPSAAPHHPNYASIRDYFFGRGEELLKIDLGLLTVETTEGIERDIENGFVGLLTELHIDLPVYGEDVCKELPQVNSYWAIDAISGTNQFAAGTSEFALCAAEVRDGEIIYAIVVAPKYSEVFEAHKGRGALLNGSPLLYEMSIGDLILNLDPSSPLCELQEGIWKSTFLLRPFVLNQASVLSYCRVAQKRYRRIISVSKDSFPYFAGTFILNQAGGVCTNIDMSINISPSDRIFIGATSNEDYSETLGIVKEQVQLVTKSQSD